MENDLVRLAVDLVRIDSRSPLSNIPVADRIEAELDGFEIERLDYTDAAGVAKRCLVAHRGGPGGLALSGHMDTVPDTGWTDDPWSGRVAGGILHGLGSVDMKANVAACIMAARAAKRATLLITTDEETTKQGARTIAEHSKLAQRAGLRGTIVAEPTSLIPVRGHRAHIAFTATAEGVQAHSSTGKGLNANWALIPFLVEVKAMFERLRHDTSLQDPAYDPPFSDFNLVIDNHGTAVNVTAAKATARIKFRYSHRIDPAPVVAAMRESAKANGLTLEEMREGRPPELPADHPLIRLAAEITGQAPRTAPYGTDASELQAVAPCVILGPGSIEYAHTPREQVPLDQLAQAVGVFRRMLDA
ncbi:M20/M25/M40 family metallo-hydrolase [Roseococcus sp. SYP-B2431]|uniref:M20/M25/M40 family metallo-hydrolase n=1 Tax=Roseococcus sp. SYP-B2431 TaxID=2496640 RepID=UPI00103CC003|nr:M20/M25/M40 family metallo-hydrolase [Roseococcus sp. SYP-B2431]TCH97859.1 M20/M25/M40 family metallo-hydrolase [Roseococcus sp. SYP-B2431]